MNELTFIVPPGVISLDPYILSFIKENAITLGILYVILREIFKATPWKFDDRILEAVVNKIKGGKNDTTRSP